MVETGPCRQRRIPGIQFYAVSVVLHDPLRSWRLTQPQVMFCKESVLRCKQLKSDGVSFLCCELQLQTNLGVRQFVLSVL